MFLGSTSSPVKPLKNLTKSEGWILERCSPQLKYWCLTSSGLWGSGGEGKAPASLERVFLSFLDNKAQDPIWLPYLGVILTVAWRWQWSKEAEWAVGPGSETRLEMWPCFQCAAAAAAQVPSSSSSLLPVWQRIKKTRGSLSMSTELCLKVQYGLWAQNELSARLGPMKL